LQGFARPITAYEVRGVPSGGTASGGEPQAVTPTGSTARSDQDSRREEWPRPDGGFRRDSVVRASSRRLLAEGRCRATVKAMRMPAAYCCDRGG
jgi:hypothetical protein